MSESTHTPGPYEFGNAHQPSHDFWQVDIYSNGAPEGSRYPFIAMGATRAEAEANARLVDTAPELLKALKTLLCEAIDEHYASRDPDGALAFARAAIAKAEGRDTEWHVRRVDATGRASAVRLDSRVLQPTLAATCAAGTSRYARVGATGER